MSTAKLFVTNDAKLAKLFNSKRNLTFDKAIASIVDNDPTIVTSIDNALLNFNNKYSRATFDSFEYSLGYGQGAGENNFKISLTLRDITGKLEELFLNGLVDKDIDLSQSDPDQLRRLAQESITTGGISPETEFRRGNNSDTLTKNVNSNILSVINRIYYFIFISDTGYFLSPVASSFFKASVTAATLGQIFKLVKLEFICIGHPFLLSELSEIGNYSSRRIHNDPNKDQTDQDYDIVVNWSLADLEKDTKKLDASIKSVLRELFKKITSKPVILLLPDFGKIYERFKNNKINSIKSSMDNDNINFNIVNSLNIKEVSNYWELKSFLNLLGFNFIPDFTARFYEKLSQLSEREKEYLEKFRGRFQQFYVLADQMIDQLVEGKITEIVVDPTRTEYEFGGTTRINTPEANFDNFLRQIQKINDRLAPEARFSIDNNTFFNAINSYAESTNLKGALIRSGTDPAAISLLFAAIEKGDIKALNQFFSIVSKNQKKDILKSIVKISYFSKLDKIINLGNEGYINYLIQSGKSLNDLEFTPEYDEKNEKVTGSVRFRISSKDKSTIAPDTNTNFVNFNVFANNLSNKLSYLSDQTYEITYGEENVISRLETLASTCYYHDENLTEVPFLSNSTEQAIVIYDSWFFNNLYAPVQGIPSEIDDELVSISDLDKKNFKYDGPYHQNCINDIGIKYYSSNGIVLPFTGYVKDVSKIKDDAQTISDEIINFFPAASSVFNQDSKAYEIPIFVWYPAGEDLLPSVNNVRRQTFGLNASIFDTESIENLPSKLQSNLDYLNVEANSLNQLAGYNSYVNEVASILTDDALISSRLAIYKNFNFDVTGFEERFNTFFAALAKNQGPNPDDFLKEVKRDIDSFVSSTPSIQTYAKLFPDSEESRLFDIGYGGASPTAGTTSFGRQRDAQEKLKSRFNNYKEQLKIRILKDLWYSALSKDPGDNNKYVANLTRKFIGNSLVSRSNMLKHLYNKYYTVKITSVFPWYQLNNVKTLNYPCLLLVFDAIKVDIEDAKSLIKPSILSGFYNIVGFKHVLTTTGNKSAYSEFVLRKNLDFGSIS